MVAALKYYGSLILAAHGASKRWLAVGATWVAYLLAASSALPSVEAALPALKEAWAGPARWAVLAGIFTISLAGENWRRFEDLQQRRRLRIRTLSGARNFSPHSMLVGVEVTNLSGAPTSLEKYWTITLCKTGEAPEAFPGQLFATSHTRAADVLEPHERREVTVEFEITWDKYIDHLPRPVEISVTDIYGNLASTRGERLAPALPKRT